MKVALLGGLGLQGRAALADLSKNEGVREILCADANLDAWDQAAPWVDASKVHPVKVEASSRKDLVRLLKQEVDVAIDLLPFPLMSTAVEAAIEAGVPLVGTNYGHTIRHLHPRAAAAGVAIMPECGLDPGIDLVICGHFVRQFDALHLLNSYCGGFPEKSACDNPLNYKISWNWDMVLRSQKRESVFIQNGERMVIPAARQHRNAMIHRIALPGFGELEAIPNGNALFYADLLNLRKDLRTAGRYSLRWPGWCAFWEPLKKMGFLSDDPLPDPSCPITPHQFMVKLLAPQLQYRDNEKDVVAMVNRFEGIKDGRKKKVVTTLVLERDLQTGLLAMNLGVAYPACIVASMLADGQIPGKGILNPATDVPYAPFMQALAARGIEVDESIEEDV
jgi:saccharopine dehydrogenase-like NADP-dependent oxidoreductase